MKRTTTLFTTLLFALASVFATENKWTAGYGPAKLFIENKGQWDGMNDMPQSKILFASDYGSSQFLFTKEGITYRLCKMDFPTHREREKREKEMEKQIKAGKQMTHREKEMVEHALNVDFAYVHMQWQNANPNVEVLAMDEASNYFTYQGIDHARAYKKLLYKNIYPNIDVEYEFHTESGIEYHFILHAGADASQIKMLYSGAQKMKLDAEKNLLLKTKLGYITEHAPKTFYKNTQQEIASGFVLHENEVGFQLAAYNTAQEVVIDPWVQAPGFNTQWDCVWECDKDGAGNAYLIGGVMPLQLLKYNAAGAIQWTYSTPYDTTSWLGTFAVDNAGNSYVTQGSVAAIQRISTAGALVWNNPSPGGIFLSTEFWSISFNCDQTKLVIGGTGNTLPPLPYIYEVNMANGNVSSSIQVTGGALFPTQEVRAITACGNGKYYFLTHDSIGYLNQNFPVCANDDDAIHYIDNSYGLGYKCENFRYNNTGIAAIRSFGNFVFTHRGNQLHKRNFATGAIVGTVNIPGGAFTTSFGSSFVENSGIDIDSCGNIYVGSKNQVVKYDQNLNQLATYPTTYNVYDVHVSTAGNIIVAGTTGDANSGPRQGSIQQIAAGACAPLAIVCCDASICQAGPFCTTDAPVTLIPSTPGGVWSGPGITNAATGAFSPSVAGQGSHIIHYTLACGSDSITIVVNLCATLTPCLNANGSVTVSGGTAPYNWAEQDTIQDCTACVVGCIFPPGCAVNGFAWNNFATGATATPPEFPVQVTDGSSNVLLITTTTGMAPCACVQVTATASGTNAGCGSNGSATVNMTTGTPPYTFSWTGGGTTQTISNLAAGTYFVTVTGNDGCTDTSSVTITGTSVNLVSITNVVQPTCALNDGSLTVSVNGGTAPYNLIIDTGSANITMSVPIPFTQNVSGLPPGTITAYVSDANGCLDTATVTLAQPSGCCSFTVVKDSAAPSCFGFSNGWIDLDVFPSGSYTYSWSPNVSTTDSAGGLAAGTYTVTVATGGSTTTTTDTLFTENFESGSANWTLNTGTGTNQWLLNNVYPGGPCSLFGFPLFNIPAVPNQMAPIVNQPNSNYLHIRATTNSNGCDAPFPPLNANFDDTQTGTQYATMIPSVNTTGYTNVRLLFYWVCAGNAACTGRVEYSLNNGATWATLPTNYNGNANAWQLANVSNVAFNNVAQLKFRFVWTNGSGGSDPAFAIDHVRVLGDITQTVGGCQSVYTTILSQPVQVSVSTTVVQPTCVTPTGSSTAIAAGGVSPYNFTWSTVPVQNTSVATNLNPGTYNVTISDQNNCTASATATLNVPNCCTFTYTLNVTQPTCGLSNGSASVTVANGSGNYSYSWSPGGSVTNSSSNLPAGNVSVTITDNGQACSQDTTFALNSNSTLSVAFSNQVNPTCAGSDGQVTVTLAGGTAPYSVTIDTGGTPFTVVIPIAGTQTLTGLPAGTINVSVTDADLCVATASATLTAPANCCTHTVSAVLVQPGCSQSNGSITLTTSNGSGNYSYNWSNGLGSASSVTNQPAGIYDVTITDNGFPNCFIDTTFTLTNPNAPVVNGISVVDETCTGSADGTITVAASGGTGTLTYSWSDSQTTNPAVNLTAGNYTFTITDANGCQVSGNGTVGSNICCTLQSNSVAVNTTCGQSNGSITVSIVTAGTTPYSYALNGATPQAGNVFNNLAGGNYTVVTFDANLCSDTQQVVVGASTGVTVNVNSTAATCNGFSDGSATANTNGGAAPLSFAWSNSGSTATISNLPAGSYSVTVTDNTGCTASASGTVSEPAPVLVNITGNLNACEGDTLMLDAGTGFLTYVWNTGQLGPVVYPTLSGTYTVYVTGVSGCPGSDSVVVGFYSNPTIELGPDQADYVGESITLSPDINGNVANATYSWSPVTGLSCGNCASPTAVLSDTITYQLIFIDQYGCTDTDWITLNVLPEGDLVFPTAFSPNGDGVNDVFRPLGSPVTEYELHIFNRWGEKIFSTTKVKEGWDGKYKYEEQPISTYVFTAKARFISGREKVYSGNVTLIR